MTNAAVLARYPLRTPRGYVAALVAITVLGAASAVMLVVWLTSPLRGAGGLLGVVLAVLATLPIWYFLTTRAYRIAGGKGEIAMYADRIELVDGRRTLVFPAATLLVGAEAQVMRYRAWGIVSLGERRVGTLIALRSGDQQVTFSSKLFDDEEWVQGFLDDVAAVYAGKPPLGPRVPEPVRPKPAATVSPEGYDYEAELDRELRRFDES